MSEVAPTIELVEASRWYGHVIALNHVTLSIRPGVVGLLGPNGAGKTTLLRLVTGLVRPTTGRVRLLGHNVWTSVDVRHRIGYCPEHDHFYENMSGLKFVTLMTRLQGFSKVEAARRAADSLERVRLPLKEGGATKTIAEYSKGMRQKVKLAQALAHDPDVLILDEPLTGCDPLSRHHITTLCRELGAQGRTVLISSHVLHEVERVTGEFILIERGRLLAQGNVYEIRKLIDKHPHRIELQCRRPRELASQLIALPHVTSAQILGDTALMLETSDPDRCYSELPEVALELGAALVGVHSPDNNLEAVFRYLTEG